MWLPCNATSGEDANKGEMVRPEGIEPPTPCLEGRCSIRLSYGRKGVAPKNRLLCSIILGRDVAEIIDIIAGTDDAGLLPGKGVFPALLMGIGHGLIRALEFQADLVDGIAGRRPPHQGFRANGAIAFIFQHPDLGLSKAGLHGVFGWFVNADLHHAPIIMGIKGLSTEIFVAKPLIGQNHCAIRKAVGA